MLLNALAGWVDAHPWMTFFVLLNTTSLPLRFIKVSAKAAKTWTSK